MGAQRGGGPNPEKVGARSGGAAGVSHDNQRAQTCTLEHPGLQKHHQNSTRRPPRERRKNGITGGREKKRAKFWAVQRKGGPAEGGPGERPKNFEHTHHTHKQQQQQQQQQQQAPGTTTTPEILAKTLKH